MWFCVPEHVSESCRRLSAAASEKGVESVHGGDGGGKGGLGARAGWSHSLPAQRSLRHEVIVARLRIEKRDVMVEFKYLEGCLR